MSDSLVTEQEFMAVMGDLSEEVLAILKRRGLPYVETPDGPRIELETGWLWSFAWAKVWAQQANQFVTVDLSSEDVPWRCRIGSRQIVPQGEKKGLAGIIMFDSAAGCVLRVSSH